MKFSFYILASVGLFMWACSNIEEANPSDNTAFIKFFHGPYNYEGVEVEIIPEGYAILGNMRVSEDSTTSILIRTDKKGTQLGSTQYFPGTVGKSLEVLYAGQQVSGYLILGDSIKLDPSSDKVGNIEIYSAKLIMTDADGNRVLEKRFTDPSLDPTKVKIDFKSNALKIVDENEVLILGTFKEDLITPEKPFIISLDNTLSMQWYKQYDILERNYVNSKSIHVNAGNIVWATAILKSTQDFNDSYLAVPLVKEESIFENFSQLGENSSQFLLPTDIQPSKIAALGYALVGTRSETDGTMANMFFARVDMQGNIIANSERYYDAIESQSNQTISVSTSGSQDQGESLAGTADGGYLLAGATKATNSNRNIYLVKIDAFGNILWNRIIGGDGDEIVSSVREENDGSFVMCGTNTLSGLSSVFLIRINSDGELSK